MSCEWTYLAYSRYRLQILELAFEMFDKSRQRNVERMDAVETKKILCAWMGFFHLVRSQVCQLSGPYL